MPAQVLSREAVRRALTSLRDDLGRVDRARLDLIFGLIAEDGRIRLGDALRVLYPDQAREAALTAFRQFRGRLGAAAREAGLAFALETDRQTRAAPDERSCWFTGQDDAAAGAARLTEVETAGIERSAQNAVELGGKRTARYFVCYAHGDRRLNEDLLTRLRHCFAAAKDYRFEEWHDGDIELGGDWHERIQAAINECDFGLLQVSPAFLASAYIDEHELPHFVARDPFRPTPGKLAAPIALKPIRFDGKMDLKGLEKRQFFHGKDGRAYQQLSGNAAKDEFAGELFVKIVEMLAAAPPAPSVPAELTKIGHRPVDRYLQEAIDQDLAGIHFVSTEGHPAMQNKLKDGGPAGERRDALAFLNEWVREPTGAPYCALLGEYGMGKTTTSMAFARALLEAREASSSEPLPIYLDLRNLGEAAKAEPDLLQIIDMVLRKSWRGGFVEIPLSAPEVVRLVQQEGAVAIFDGLDEVLVHLSPAAGQRFTREIFRILPPALFARRRKPNTPSRPGRVLVTCRTHYFRTVRDQKAHLTAEDRGDVRADDYRVFVLLPFTDRQIRDYLQLTLPGENIERVLETIRAVHNLPELAERPYTLSLIARHFPDIERWKLEGRRVTGVDLYHAMVLSWLERDAGKHQITPDHKQHFMEYFAAELWCSGKRAWSVGDVEQWLIDFLHAHPSLAAHYDGKDRELLKEDIRTATFLVREGEAAFRFAHTSLQEFFLARYLHRALTEGRVEEWTLPRPSRETLEFLGQLLLGGSESGRAIVTLRAMRDTYRAQISELAFAYVLLAHERGYPAPSPAGFQLGGADLRHWNINGRSGEPLLSLRVASFRGARMLGASLSNLDLENADFSRANLVRAELIGGRARNAHFAGTELTGTVFRDINLESADFTDAVLHRSEFLHCRLTGTRALDVTAPHALFALCEPPTRYTSISIADPRLAVLDGHCGAVNGCAFAPDGRRLASASRDGTVRLWDPESGECLAVLRGHEGEVLGCAFAPDGTHLVSASSDCTLRLWDFMSGECLVVLRGHRWRVSGCAFAPDGTRLASASFDRTLRLWDATSGQCLAVLRGHEGRLFDCAFAPDGMRLVSASRDRTLRLWDAASGECLSVLRGHEGEVLGCAFAPDGTRLASTSDDSTLRVWDADSGECLAVLRGHENAVRGCAFSPNGTRLASASDDRTVRVWDAVSGECLAVLRGHRWPVRGCAFAPDGTRLGSAGQDSTAQLWDVVSGECLAILRGHESWVRSCAFAPDGARFVSASEDDELRVWDAASGVCLSVLRGHKSWVWSCAFAPDGTRLVSASHDGTLRLWAMVSGECLSVLRGHESAVRRCAFAPDGRRLASASFDDTLRVWDPASGECLAVLRGHKTWVSGCAFAPDGTLLASGSDDGTVRLWDTGSGECMTVLQGRKRGPLDGVFDCAFAPDGTRLASASRDGTVRIWEIASRKCVAVLSGHEDEVLRCAFAPDGTQLASASRDGTVRIWEIASCKCVAVLRGHEDWVWDCAFSPDGTRLISASADGSLRVWNLMSAQETGFRVHFFSDESWASLNMGANKIVHVSGNAWRWLGWLAPDANGAVTRYPAEVFGNLTEYTLL